MFSEMYLQTGNTQNTQKWHDIWEMPPSIFKDSNGKEVTFLFLKELIRYHESILCEKNMNVAKKFKSDQKYYRGEWLNKYKHITK